jgi:hypothetical protein
MIGSVLFTWEFCQYPHGFHFLPQYSLHTRGHGLASFQLILAQFSLFHLNTIVVAVEWPSYLITTNYTPVSADSEYHQTPRPTSA